MFLWSSERADLVVPWSLIGSKQDAHRVAQALRAAQVAHNFGRRMGSAGESAPATRRTDVSSAIELAAALLRGAPYDAARAVANICGNGRDNVGAHPNDARNRALAGASSSTASSSAIDGALPNTTALASRVAQARSY